MLEKVKYWFEEAEKDLDSAKNIMKSGEYHWSLFIGHLSLEKIIKAYYVKIHSVNPPFIHNLLRLAELSKIGINDSLRKELGEINTFNLNARYDHYKKEFYKKATKEYTEKWREQ